jgi:gluconolactonase
MLYLTDPSRPGSRDDARIWRVDVDTGESELLVSVPWYANGIGFGLEDDALYVASSNARQIILFPLSRHGLGEPAVFVQMQHNAPDGFAFDCDGNLLVAAASLSDRPGEIQQWNRSGRLTAVYTLGDARLVTNVAVNAEGRMAVTLSDHGAVAYVDGWATPGLPLHPFR